MTQQEAKDFVKNADDFVRQCKKWAPDILELRDMSETFNHNALSLNQQGHTKEANAEVSKAFNTAIYAVSVYRAMEDIVALEKKFQIGRREAGVPL